MSKQTKSGHTGLLIGAGAAVLLMMAGALFFLRWALSAGPANAPPTALTAAVLILPVIVTFALFALLMQRVWKNPKNGGDSSDHATRGDT